MKCLTSKCTSVQLETLDAFSLNTALIFHILCFVQTRTYHPIHPGRFSYQKPTFSVNSWHINQISAQAGDDGRCLSNPSTTYCHLLPASGWDWSSEVIMGHQNDSMQEKEYDVWDGSVLQHCETPWWQQSADSFISPFSPFFYYFSSADQESPLHLHYEFKPGAHDECAAYFFAHIYMLHSAAKQNKRKKKELCSMFKQCISVKCCSLDICFPQCVGVYMCVCFRKLPTALQSFARLAVPMSNWVTLLLLSEQPCTQTKPLIPHSSKCYFRCWSITSQKWRTQTWDGI